VTETVEAGVTAVKGSNLLNAGSEPGARAIRPAGGRLEFVAGIWRVSSAKWLAESSWVDAAVQPSLAGPADGDCGKRTHWARTCVVPAIVNCAANRHSSFKQMVLSGTALTLVLATFARKLEKIRELITDFQRIGQERGRGGSEFSEFPDRVRLGWVKRRPQPLLHLCYCC